MAVILLNQKDAAASCGMSVACGTGATLGTMQSELDTTAGVGSSEQTQLITTGLGNRTLFYFQTQNSPTLPNVTTWQAGDYVVRFNVTTGSLDIRLRAVYICKISGGCGFDVEVASETGLDVKLGAGVYTRTVNRGSDFSADATDMLVITLVVENVSTMFDRTLGITPDQVIDTPIDDGVSPGPAGQPKLALMGAGF